MKKLVREIVFGSNPVLSGLIALAVIGSIALGCNCNKDFDLANLGKDANKSASNSTADAPSSGAVPSDEVIEGLVKETIAEFANAVDTKDFSELYENTSEDFQSTYTLPEVEAAFKSYTDKKSIVMPIFRKVATTDAEFTPPPGVRNEKSLSILMAKGKFATKPYGVRFDFEYVLRGGEWKLLKLIINVP